MISKSKKEISQQKDKKEFIDINKYITSDVKDVPFLNKTIVISGLLLVFVSVLAITIVFIVIYYC